MFVSEIEKITDDTKRMSLAEMHHFTRDCLQLNDVLSDPGFGAELFYFSVCVCRCQRFSTRFFR
jgi:hypothetical protein